MRRIVFHPAILGWFMRGCNDNSFGEPVGAANIVFGNGPGHRGRRCYAILSISCCGDTVASKNFQRHVRVWVGNRVSVAAHKKRTVDSMHFPVVANSLNNCCDVIFVEGSIDGTAAVPRCTNRYVLARNRYIGFFLKKASMSLPTSSAADGSISAPARGSTSIAHNLRASVTHNNAYAMDLSVIQENDSFSRHKVGTVCG